MPFRLFREHCILTPNGFVKDLRCLGRNLENVIIIDNSPISYSLQKENGLPILSWYGDVEDTELVSYIPLLESLNKSSRLIKSVSKIVKNNEVVRNPTYILMKAEANAEDSEPHIKPLRVNNFLSAENSDQKVNAQTTVHKKEITCVLKKSVEVKENASSDIMKLIKRMSSYTPSTHFNSNECANKKGGKMMIGSPSTRYSNKKAYEFSTPAARDKSHPCHSSMKFEKDAPKPCTIYSNLLKMSVDIKKEFINSVPNNPVKPVITFNVSSKNEHSKAEVTSNKAKPMISSGCFQVKVSVNSPKYSSKFYERPQSSACMYKPTRK